MWWREKSVTYVPVQPSRGLTTSPSCAFRRPVVPRRWPGWGCIATAADAAALADTVAAVAGNVVADVESRRRGSSVTYTARENLDVHWPGLRKVERGPCCGQEGVDIAALSLHYHGRGAGRRENAAPCCVK